MVIIDIFVTLLHKSQFVLLKCTEIQLYFTAIFFHLTFYFLLFYLFLLSSVSSHMRIQCFSCLLTGKRCYSIYGLHSPKQQQQHQQQKNTKQPTKQKIWKTARRIQIRLSNFILNMRYNLNHSINNVEFFFFLSQNVL